MLLNLNVLCVLQYLLNFCLQILTKPKDNYNLYVQTSTKVEHRNGIVILQ